ncbi:hypothetical protein AT15_10375 [Kosmotoga arenicorallina S304]|uniref:Calcineurin-like phosphoesterase domain-containing protein n=1 Tax=Kosmotoga arenicorallina S304 TaxID=1453497 RepID=A0A176K180_9BACT|nr:metallophosphoesterase [Kosmotoga arenicorallina]MDK2953980.1 uncharacterized protein [Kosmotoga sp.]OAA30435.1 hypothetical protein AT15_10375 [Kosmotoga arenicorallina S304]
MKGFLGRISMVLLTLIVALAFYSLVLEPEFLTVKYLELSNDKGLRVLFFSDLHMNRLYSFHERLIKKAKELNPDYIVFGGDAIKQNTNFEDLERFFTSLSEIAPVYAVVGNWDFEKLTEIKAVYRNSGVRLLEGNTVKLAGDTGFINLVGMPLSEKYATPASNDVLLVSHYPHAVARYYGPDPIICLSGHTHGGQFYIPLLSDIILKSRYPLLKGEGKFGTYRVFVTNGVGSWAHLRFLAPPQFVVLDF